MRLLSDDTTPDRNPWSNLSRRRCAMRFPSFSASSGTPRPRRRCIRPVLLGRRASGGSDAVLNVTRVSGLAPPGTPSSITASSGVNEAVQPSLDRFRRQAVAPCGFGGGHLIRQRSECDLQPLLQREQAVGYFCSRSFLLSRDDARQLPIVAIGEAVDEPDGSCHSAQAEHEQLLFTSFRRACHGGRSRQSI
jgi:hypothetical protein